MSHFDWLVHMQDRKARGELPAPIDGELRLPPVEALAENINAMFHSDPPDEFFLGLLVGLLIMGGLVALGACLWAIRWW